MKKILILMTVLLSFSCTNKKQRVFELGKSDVKFDSLNEYLNKKEEKISEGTLSKFMFLNNPYSLDDNNVISIYLNSYLVYRGGYKKHIELKGNVNEIFANEKRMIMVMEILTDKTQKTIWQHRFQSKTIFSWNESYKIIYCGFFPTNEDVEKVYFIPQAEPLI